MDHTSPNNTMGATTFLSLHTHKLLRRATVNHLYIAVYTAAILSLLYHHTKTLLVLLSNSTTTSTTSSFIFSLLLFVADLGLGFTWACTQAFLIRPIRRREFVGNLEKAVEEEEREYEYPAVDVFICTADPQKEPPMGTVNTALSVMGYDYPSEKMSVYVSDDGGAQCMLFAFMEAAKFARHWLPFCRDNHLVERCPQAYFATNSYTSCSSTKADEIKIMYESMKVRVENAVEGGLAAVEDYIIEEEEMRQVFGKWTPAFSRNHHPTIIQVLLESGKDKDVGGKMLPNLIYVSREKSKTNHHHFKAGALNALVRVSATMTNAPMILTLDCDSYSNDPQTVKRAMCYFCDPLTLPTLAYVQFPQIFRGLNKGDIYHGEHKRLYQINPIAMDGLQGPNYVGTGCFFQRRAFFGSPSSIVRPEIPELSPDCVVDNKLIGSMEVLELAHRVAASDYDDCTEWGSKLGFRYGSLSEDFNTGYRMHCVGWRSIFCHPERPAFLGDSPVTLIDFLGQNKRWMHGLLGIFLSKCSTITYGVRHMGLIMGLAYTNNPCWPILSIPITLYAFIPQIALLNGVSLFPKVSDPWFVLYIFLYITANAKDLLDFMLEKGTFQRWWNSQRMWMICGVSSFLFGFVEYILSSLGIAMHGFNVTSKLQDDELRKRYDQGVFEFGVASPMFVPLTMAAIINLISFVFGIIGILTRGMLEMEGLILQILVSGLVVINCWPVYEAMVFRNDKGRMPTKITLVAASLVSILCMFACAFVKI